MSDAQCLEGDCAPHLSGEKVNPPFSATLTVMLSAETQAARPKKTGRMAVKRMSQTKRKG